MSEYWVSKKKYFCKYCEIYIADDIPSRQQHENGLRHKGNVERFVRGIYKTGEKQKKDREDEKREMQRVERAAAAAFAQDLGSGLAKPTISRPGPSGSSTAEKPAPKPSNPYANYSTPASLGYTDLDAERLAAEIAVRQTQGTAGDWQMVTPSFPQSVSSKVTTTHLVDTPATTTAGGEAVAVGTKRAAEQPPEEDARSFKIRKKKLQSGLGEIYDPGVTSIKVKKKEPQEDAPLDTSSKSDPQPDGTRPKWTNIQLVNKTPSTGDVVSDKKVESPTPASRESTPASSKWAKAKLSQPLVDAPPSDRTSMFGPREENPPPSKEHQKPIVKTENTDVKVEEEASGTPPDVTLSGNDVGGGSLFKKRRAPGSSSIGRKPF